MSNLPGKQVSAIPTTSIISYWTVLLNLFSWSKVWDRNGKEMCCNTEGIDIFRERPRCSLTQHWHQRLYFVSPWPWSAGLCNLPVLHSCFVSYSCHKDQLFWVLQATDLEWERCFKRIGTHTFSSSLGRPFGSNPVQHNTSNARSKLPEELPCTLTHSSAALTSLYTKKRKRAEKLHCNQRKALLLFSYFLFSPWANSEAQYAFHRECPWAPAV